MNVSAIEKSTGKEKKITITNNDSGRLSQDEIERMLSEAEKFKAEDDANRNRVEAKNALENYCYSLKASIDAPEVEGKIPGDSKAKLESAINETIGWLDNNGNAEKEEFEEKQKALEAVAMPILQSMSGGGGVPGGAGGMPGAGAPSPADNPAGGVDIEEID